MISQDAEKRVELFESLNLDEKSSVRINSVSVRVSFVYPEIGRRVEELRQGFSNLLERTGRLMS